ncbi:hypothetical protein [Halobellus ordinarius]|nr:hypothetical protein [Halobellus sp. ZY16]
MPGETTGRHAREGETALAKAADGRAHSKSDRKGHHRRSSDPQCT